MEYHPAFDFKKSWDFDPDTSWSTRDLAELNTQSVRFTKAAVYTFGGGGYSAWIVFDRPQPQYPGMKHMSGRKRKAGLQFHRVSDLQPRLPGTIRYSIILDSCEMMREETERWLQEFLESLIVD